VLLTKVQGWPTTVQLVKSHLTGMTVAELGRIAQYSPPYRVTAKEIEKAATEAIHNNLFRESPTQ
jgi:hypothetical protein